MAHDTRRGKEPQASLNRDDHQFIQAFEADYARLIQEKGLAAAKLNSRRASCPIFCLPLPGQGGTALVLRPLRHVPGLTGDSHE
jgi:hypothetical protein